MGNYLKGINLFCNWSVLNFDAGTFSLVELVWRYAIQAVHLLRTGGSLSRLLVKSNSGSRRRFLFINGYFNGEYNGGKEGTFFKQSAAGQ